MIQTQPTQQITNKASQSFRLINT